MCPVKVHLIHNSDIAMNNRRRQFITQKVNNAIKQQTSFPTIFFFYQDGAGFPQWKLFLSKKVGRLLTKRSAQNSLKFQPHKSKIFNQCIKPCIYTLKILL